MQKITKTVVSKHVLQLAVPTPTIPPAFETNTYLIYDGSEGLLVDLGTQDPDSLHTVTETLLQLKLSRVSLLATHYHRDHTQGLPFLQSRLNTPVYLHPLDLQLAQKEMQVPAGLTSPVPKQLQLGSVSVDIDHRPGHTHGHVHVRIPTDSVVLVGDNLAGTGSVWIGPPDGHLNDYYDSLDAVIYGNCQIAGPGHGPVIRHAQDAARKQKKHRQDRQQQILSHLKDWRTVDHLVDAIYADTIPEAALWAARKTVQAHLQYLLVKDGIIQKFNKDQMRTQYRRFDDHR
ncbi:MBL fold metallo-hydrolase [Alicyclobacillus sp. SO9]|uniref:MBL fold metallo-hydrolase n=1 Tax=Alicyclobacillus sp. SO9 TaxID=2665646 RepID=UPI0018E6DD7C|nr:MBL fold metallo-hydrolase [Alicyclobacillus sp. SO9]QQE77132.1 MBL fold metallo-hydrolase [Alicyclobacillus sp. SO9]